jgi:hypothetical protein
VDRSTQSKPTNQKAAGTGGFFPRFNALIDGGWLGKLSPVEIAVLMVHLRFMDAGGIAWPSCRKIAEIIGHSTTDSVQRARSNLIKRGLLVDAGEWMNNGIDARHLKLVIAPPDELTTPRRINRGSNRRSTPRRIGGTPPVKSTANPPSNRRDILSYEQLKDSPNESPKRGEAAGCHSELVRIFCGKWEEKCGRKYTFAKGKDGAHIKSILAVAGGDVQKAEKIIDRYLSDDDPFNVRNSHALGILISKINTYTGDRAPSGRGLGSNGHPNNGKAHVGAIVENLPL